MLAPHAPEVPPWTRAQLIGAAVCVVCLAAMPIRCVPSIPRRDPAGDARPPGTALLYGATVDVNAAPPEDLETLPGIGPAKARRLLAARARAGGFCDVEEVRRAAGVGARDWARAVKLIRLAPSPRCSSSSPG